VIPWGWSCKATTALDNDDIAYHVTCVKRGNKGALLIADLPFMAYATLEQALDNSAQLMRAGAHMVKLEGGAWLAETVRQLHERGIPVCVHMGLTPQSVNVLGGYKVQGREHTQAQQMRDDALRLQEAGAAMLLLECVPDELGTEISRSVSVPVIGIGAGSGTDGQVLVLHDMLGLSLSGRMPKFVKNFMAGQADIPAALKAYVQAVKAVSFPSLEHGFRP
jgi:3-methyl-2-oxobutanoate hydroxymethyltransferase